MTEMKRPRVNIAVIGGGMVGLSLLQLIAKYLPDCRACLIEAHAFDSSVSQQPSFDRRSTALARGSIEIFDALGLWSSMKRKTTPISRVHVTDRGHIGSAVYDAQTANASREETSMLGCVVENSWLGQQLLRGLDKRGLQIGEAEASGELLLSETSGVSILAPAHLENIRPRQGHVQLSIDQEGTKFELDAELVIVADGAASSTREKLGIGVERTPYHQAAVIANVEYTEAHQGVAFERFTARGPMALLPLGEALHARTSALVWTHPTSEVDRVMQWSDDEFLKQLQLAFGYRLGKFTRVSTRVSYPLELLQASEQIRSNIVLMGNAAHYLHPVAGQGFNLALRDCAQLISVLQTARMSGKSLGELELLQRYLDKQEGDQWLTTQLSHNFNRVFSNNQKAWQFVRNVGLISLELCSPLKQQFFAQMMGQGQKQIQLHGISRSDLM